VSLILFLLLPQFYDAHAVLSAQFLSAEMKASYVSSSSWCVVKTMKKKWKLEISWITSKRMQCRQGMSPPRFLA